MSECGTVHTILIGQAHLQGLLMIASADVTRSVYARHRILYVSGGKRIDNFSVSLRSREKHGWLARLHIYRYWPTGPDTLCVRVESA